MENPYEYSTIILSILFFASEVMPFLKKYKTNGLLESAICVLQGSECTAKKIADQLETIEKEEKV